MTKNQAVKFFGSQAEIARRCGLTRQAVQKWPDVVPLGWSYFLSTISGGKLKPSRMPRAEK